MGGDDHIGHGDEPRQHVVAEDMAGTVLKKDVPLLLVHVQTGRAHLPRLDALQQGFRVDQRAPGGVQEDHTLFHLPDGVGTDHVPGLVRQGTVEGDDVGPGEQLRQGYIVDAAVGNREFVVGDHPHAEAPADVDENTSDLPGADHARGLPVEVEAREPAQGEIEVPGAVVGLVDTPDRGEQQRRRVFRHGVGGVGGDVDHMDLSEGVAHVHIVVSGGAQGDEPYPAVVQPVNDGGVRRVVDEDAHRLAALRQCRRIRAELGFQKFEFHAGLCAAAFKGRPVVGLCIEKGDLHGCFLLVKGV